MGWLIGSKFWEYVGEGLVLIGVVLEVICERKLVLKNDDARRGRLEGRGAYMLIAGLAVSFAALIATNSYFDKTIADLNLKSSQADERAAKDEADAASLKADNLKLALELAQQEQATAEAAKEAALANAKIGGWKLDAAAKKRFAGYVKKFPGTPFDLAVNPVETPFMEELDTLLTSPSVGWVRVPPKPVNGQTVAILIDGKASIILSSGIVLEVDQDQTVLKPALVALGTALHEELDLKKVALHLVPPGSWGHSIHIIIGKRE